MVKSKIELPRLQADFDSRVERVFSYSDLGSVLSPGRFHWNLPRNMGPDAFIDMLLRRTKMTKVTLKSPDYPEISRYVWGANIAPVLLALSIKPRAFCSHGSAMWIHGLGGTERPIYVNSEQSEKPANRNKLTQEAIDRAFLREQRKSKLVYKYKDTEIIVLNGKNSHRLEVERGKTPPGEEVETTSLERTLIDITVRPAYAGGISSVLEAFRIARGKASIEKLLRILNALDYSYPYHQSVGFYMKLNGYPEADLDLVRKLGAEVKFYLGHGLKDPVLEDEFKVYFPRLLQAVLGS